MGAMLRQPMNAIANQATGQLGKYGDNGPFGNFDSKYPNWVPPSMPATAMGGGTSAAGQTLRPNGAVATAANAAPRKGGGGTPAPNAAAGAQPVAPFAPAQPGQLKSLLGS